MRPVSKKRAAEMPERRRVRQLVFERDEFCCTIAHLAHNLGLPGCAGALTPHHRRKASQGGGYTVANLCSMCQVHNDLLESDPTFASRAHKAGFVILRGDPNYEAFA